MEETLTITEIELLQSILDLLNSINPLLEEFFVIVTCLLLLIFFTLLMFMAIKIIK